MTDSAQGSGGRGEGGGGDTSSSSQPVFFAPSPLNVFGVDHKHFQKWMRVWEEKRTFSEVQPSGEHLKKLNCVSPEFLLRSGRSKQWRARVVVLRGHFLYYFRYPVKPNHPCRGVVLVKGCAVTTFQSFEGKCNVVMIGPNTTRKPGWRPDLTRRFYFSLSSPAELNKWYQMLKLAAHTEKTYNKYMVKTITVPTSPPPMPPAQAATATTTAAAAKPQISAEATVDSDPVQHNNSDGPQQQKQKKRSNNGKKKTSSGEAKSTPQGDTTSAKEKGGADGSAAEQTGTNPLRSSSDKSKKKDSGENKKKRKSKQKHAGEISDAKPVLNESS